MTNPKVVNLKQTGKDIGIDFNFTCPVYPYTVPAHVFVKYAEKKEDSLKLREVVDRLFKAYFTKGRPLEKRHLLKIAREVGFNLKDLERFLDDPAEEEEVKMKSHSWREQGVHAIPFFFMNGQATCSGAQDTDDFVSTILKVAEKYPAAETTS